ncbi:MAG: DNA replication/repair protein RecF [bacterium]|nr:DNA replication/repair protein RecF [bacterium]
MYIESLELENYRNYRTLHMEFHKGTNVLYGDNAQGKTNVLEALYLCATAKSHKGSKDRELIRFGEEEAHIKLRVKRQDVSYRIDMHLKKNKTKGVAINGIPIHRASELFGILNVVFFAPEDLDLIKDGPAARRRFLDVELCQLNKLYVHNLVQYNRALLQRNKLLKELSQKPQLADTLDVWDLQLFRYGRELIGFRGQFVDKLNALVADTHKNLSGGKEELRIQYEPCVREEDFEAALRKGREQDLRQKSTLVGPHRDDLSFLVNGMDIRKFGSQGQQRTAALSLKLSEIDLVKQLIGEEPVLLLDDVLSELDSHRQNQLLSVIRRTQTVVTCTGLQDFLEHHFEIDKVFEVVNGTIVDEHEY